MITRSKKQIWISASKRASLFRKKPLDDNFIGMSLGISFEEKVLNDLRTRSGIYIPTVANTITDETVARTILYMKQGLPMIHSAPLRDTNNHTHGIADLLVRSDSFHRFFPVSPLDRKTRRIPSSFSRSYHYVVVEIKYATLYLLDNERVDEEKHKSHKAQLEVYNNALELIQGYKPTVTFLLGHRQVCGRRITSSFRDRLGRVCMMDVLEPPKSGEISKVWFCTTDHQEILDQHKIKSLKDKRCTAELLGFSGKREVIIDAILEVQRGKAPLKIGNRSGIPSSKDDHYYIDIEMFPCNQRISMIGMYHPTIGYKHFMGTSNKASEEKRIVKEFLDFLPKECTLFHWGNIDSLKIKKASEKYQLNVEGLKWFDMNIMFKACLIAVKDCYTYKLKDIGRSMYKHGLISTTWEDTAEVTVNIMKEEYRERIINYNRTDCVVLHEIMDCLYKE
jgi:hypothetical protein